jgi:hypothetical protein
MKLTDADRRDARLRFGVPHVRLVKVKSWIMLFAAVLFGWFAIEYYVAGDTRRTIACGLLSCGWGVIGIWSWRFTRQL